jgi:hypothetical protein
MPENDYLKVKVHAKNRQSFVLRAPERSVCTVSLDIGDGLIVDVYGYDGEGYYARASFELW